MRHEEGSFESVRGLGVYHQCWLPQGESRAVLLIVHGLGRHSGRYGNVVDRFVPLGYGVYGMDLIGHGRSDGARLHVRRFADYTDSLKTYLDMVRDRQPGKPTFLVGYSLGGLICATYLLDHQSELKGAVLAGPLIRLPGGVSPVLAFVARMLSALVPRLGVADSPADGFCRDPAVIEAYANDPLSCKGKITARLGFEFFKAMQRVTAEAAKITTPILILQGGDDKFVDPAGSQMLHDTIGSADRAIKIYDGLYHEVFNEPEHAQVLGDVEAWLEPRLGS